MNEGETSVIVCTWILLADKIILKATTDAPCVNFSDDLLEAYPSVKVILATRDPDAWLRSIENCFYRILQDPWFRAMEVLDKVRWGLLAGYIAHRSVQGRIGLHGQLLRAILTDWTRPGHWQDRAALRTTLLDHWEHIREVVPKEQLLEIDIQSLNWKPICEFLEKPIPEGDFPKINEGDSIWQLTRRGLGRRSKVVLERQKWSISILLACVAIVIYLVKGRM